MKILEQVLRVVLALFIFGIGVGCILEYMHESTKYFSSYCVLFAGVLCVMLALALAGLWVFK